MLNYQRVNQDMLNPAGKILVTSRQYVAYLLDVTNLQSLSPPAGGQRLMNMVSAAELSFQNGATDPQPTVEENMIRLKKSRALETVC